MWIATGSGRWPIKVQSGFSIRDFDPYIHGLSMVKHAFTEGSLEAKLPTIWTDGKAQPGRSSEWRKSEGRRYEMEKIRDGEDQKGRRSEERRCSCAKRWESRNTLCFSNVLWLRSWLAR